MARLSDWAPAGWKPLPRSQANKNTRRLRTAGAVLRVSWELRLAVSAQLGGRRRCRHRQQRIRLDRQLRTGPAEVALHVLQMRHEHDAVAGAVERLGQGIDAKRTAGHVETVLGDGVAKTLSQQLELWEFHLMS